MPLPTCLVFMALFYGICIYGLLCDGGFLRIKKLYFDFRFSEKIALRIAIIFILGFVFYWAKQDRFVYFWDYALYWTASINRMKYIFSHSFSESFYSLLNSINTQDYNDVLPSVVALPLKVFGYTHTKYVFLNFLLFFIPTVLVQGLIGVKLISDSVCRPALAYVFTTFAAAFFQANYYAGLHSFIDIGYLLPLSVSMYLFVDYDFNRISIPKNIAISLCLILSWISRRYVIYFIFGFVVAMVVKAISALVNPQNRGGGGGALRPIISNFLIIGGCSLFILLTLFREFFLHALLTQYGFMYSAYDAPLSQKIQSLIAAFGIISFVIIFIIGLFSFLYKKHRTNYICMWSMLISESIMFWQVQNMAVQHRMILNLPIFICFILLFSFWSSSISKRFISRTIIVGCVLLQLFNFAKAFAPSLPVSGKFQIFAERYYPFQRNDLDALRQLDTKLNSLTSGTNDYVYVAASGWFLNDSILQCIDAPTTDRAVPNMFNSNHIDLRDGFPTDFLQARYVVTTTPIQTHLNSGQEVITYLSDSVQNSSNYLGIHFQKIYQIELDNYVIAEVYEKVSDFTQDDLSKLRAYFCTLYPDSPELFADRIQ